MCLLINTCKNYFSNISSLIVNLNQSKFPKENILIVSGQEDEYSVSYIDGIKVVKVIYTALHLTACVYIYENMYQFDTIKYWVLLPDTIKFGPSFFDKLMSYYDIYLKNKEEYSLSFINPLLRPSMDMGIIHTKHLFNMSNYLNKMKTYVNIEKNIQEVYIVLLDLYKYQRNFSGPKTKPVLTL